MDGSEIDFELLIPVVLLHGVGYSKVPKGSNPFNLDIRKLHSEEGRKWFNKKTEECYNQLMKERKERLST